MSTLPSIKEETNKNLADEANNNEEENNNNNNNNTNVSAGGRRSSRKNSRKNRKNSRKNRKNSRKNRKNSRKNSRKNRKNSRKNIMNMMGGGCGTMPSSLAQGQAFQNMTRNLHGGRRMQGGGEPGAFPFSDSTLLHGSDRVTAQQGQLDGFYRDSQTAIPSSMRYSQSGGGALAPASLSQTDMLLPRSLSESALNPQWRMEGGTNPEIGRMADAEAAYRSTNYSDPGFKGPANAYATQAGGRRRSSRKNRKASRKNRKNRKNSRKH
jgi:hypothetical protein